eukprot:CAMPEP_0182915884 /NCGR_PEP_ID=MMETSP0105_2-20130417/598_1 /TAXON_ID=81532 ORGANISM="Acanthoeca-like sp., Strain 10tr" /NCGR_SAMPLE_ID=MMETSP0105_2 /ASSEMBLY_ACC=CAM_ASM_000205 /LENGTH=453 /DNA_ID=CAMNT_0025052783 /DNA_START=28 /DNA_END=1389 /DNA_ORIENTATION=-
MSASVFRGAVALVATVAGSAGQGCSFVKGMDVGSPSTIIKHMPSIASEDECCAACSSEPACVVAILFAPANAVAGCWLKDGTGGNESKSDALACFLPGRQPASTAVNLTMLPSNTSGRCMDGSPSGYYFAANKSSTTWVLNLEGGGECASKVLCESRRGSALYSSKYFKQRMDDSNGGYLTSGDASNPLADANRVFIPYCSQDLWTGQRRVASADTWGFYFSGHLVLEAVLDELDQQGLKDATRIILSGESAGGIGVWPNLDWLAHRYPLARVIGVPIAGFYFWAYPYEGPGHTQSGLADFREPAWPGHVALWDSFVDAECAAAIGAWKCVLANNSFPYITSEAFIVESNVDKVVTTAHDWVPGGQDPNWSSSVLAYFKEWAANMTVGLTPSMSPSSKNGVFNPACFIHTSFGDSGPILEGKTYLQAFAQWLEGSPVKLQDSCGILCNPSCPH